MKRNTIHRMRSRTAKMLVAGAVLTQAGSCNFGEVSTSVTLSGQELIITLIRSAILSPIDAYVTNAVNEIFDNDE